jgi:membrane fusion protein, multidrug efflux system
MKRRLNLIIALTLVLGVFGCKGNGDREVLKKIETDRFLVSVEKSTKRDIENNIVLVGSATAMDEAVLFPRASGKLLRNLLQEGDAVKKDQAVALIERDEVGVVYEPAPVPSTISGVMGRVYQDVGTNVTVQTPIALVVNQSKIRIKVDLPERYVSKVKMWQEASVTVDAFPNKTFEGKVFKISPVVDSQSRSVPIEIIVSNSDRLLKSGMFCKVKLVLAKSENVICVPKSAVQKDADGNAYVFVAQGDKAARVDVKTGIEDDEHIEISSGLDEGTDVIYSGLFGVADGSKIKVSETQAN